MKLSQRARGPEAAPDAEAHGSEAKDDRLHHHGTPHQVQCSGLAHWQFVGHLRLLGEALMRGRQNTARSLATEVPQSSLDSAAQTTNDNRGVDPSDAYCSNRHSKPVATKDPDTAEMSSRGEREHEGSKRCGRPCRAGWQSRGRSDRAIQERLSWRRPSLCARAERVRHGADT